MADRSPKRVFSLFAIAFLAFAVVEFVLFGWVASQIGWWILAVMLGLGLAGGALIALAGKQSVEDLRQAIRDENTSQLDLASRGYTFLAGVLLIIPGFLTDIIAIFLMLPFARPLVSKAASTLGRKLWQPITIVEMGMTIPGEVVEENTGDVSTKPSNKNDGPLIIEGTVIDNEQG